MLCELLQGGFQLGCNNFVQQAPRSFKHVPSFTQAIGKHEHQQQHFAPFCKNRGCRSLDCVMFFFLPLKKAAARFQPLGRRQLSEWHGHVLVEHRWSFCL